MLDLATAEYSLVGCVLIDARCLPAAREILPTAEAFASEPCRKAYAAACRLEDEDKGIDPVIVGRAAGLSNDFLMQCMDLAPTCTRAAEYAKAVLDGHQRRQLQALGEKLQTEALCAGSTADQLLTEARSTLDDLASTPGRCSVKSARDSLLDFMTFRAEVQQGKRQAIRTGFPSLDALTSGFQKGDFIIVAARPSMGKTAFVLNMAKNMSISSAHKHVAFFSLEMSREQLVQRLLCSTALIDSAKLRTGRISTQKEWDQLANAASVLMDAPLYIDDTPGVSVSEIRSKCRRLKAEQGLDIIMIDYLQLMQAKSAARSGDNRQQEISEISRSLKSLARELNVPVIALSQLSRSVEARQDHRPFLSDLRESGSLEQDADMVSFLYREAYYNREIEDDDPRKNETEIILAKNRNGPVDTVKLHFAGQFTLFYEITNQEPPPDMQ